MIERSAEGLLQLVAVMRRAGAFGAAVRVGILASGLLVAWLMRHAGPDAGSTVLGTVVLLGAVAAAGWPAVTTTLPMAGTVALWLLWHHPTHVQLGALVLLLWLAHRLCCWAASAPSHVRTTPGAIRLLLRDAAVEALWTLTAIALVVAGATASAWLPRSPLWTMGLLLAAAVAALAWLGRRQSR